MESARIYNGLSEGVVFDVGESLEWVLAEGDQDNGKGDSEAHKRLDMNAPVMFRDWALVWEESDFGADCSGW